MTTVLLVEGLTEIDPYGLFTETPAFGPTLKCHSLWLSATSVPATMAPTTTSLIVRVLIEIPQACLTLPAGSRSADRTCHYYGKELRLPRTITAKNGPLPSQRAWLFPGRPPSANAEPPRHPDRPPHSSPHPEYRHALAPGLP